MTHVDVDRADALFVPSGRPVARFVTGLAVIFVLLGVLAWSGLVAPHVAVHVSANTYSIPARSGEVWAVVENRGPSPAYIGPITSGNRFVHLVSSRGAVGRRVDGGASTRVAFAFKIDCGFASRPDLDVRVRVRGVAGLGRSLRVYSAPVDARCVDGRPTRPLP